MQTNEIPLAFDFAFEIPEEVKIESKTQAGDCVTWGSGGCDDD
ncbi:MAG: hypothetical protein NUV82_02820 [Candidatus Komeilibacteria bacterium]|nr:hypothetical protein [Candidatus Komeilibacteria bacterium]